MTKVQIRSYYGFDTMIRCSVNSLYYTVSIGAFLCSFLEACTSELLSKRVTSAIGDTITDLGATKLIWSVTMRHSKLLRVRHLGSSVD